MNETLLTILDEIYIYNNQLEEIASLNEGEIPDSFEMKEIELYSKLSSKIDNYIGLIKYLESKVETFKNEKENIDRKKKAIENTLQRLEDYLKYSMESNKEKSIDGTIYSVKLRNNGGKQPVKIDEEDVTAEYMKQIEVIDREKIVSELNSGKKLPFARLLERGKHIAIV